MCRQQCTTIIGYSFLGRCIFVQAAVHIICFFNHMHIFAVPILIGFPWNQQHLPAPKKGVFHHDAFGHVLGCLWALCTLVDTWMEVAPITTNWGVEIDGWVWFNKGSPLSMWTVGNADFLNNGAPNVHGFYWPTLLERLHISCSAANKIGLLHQGVQTKGCEHKLSWWMQTCWWISWLKQIIIISSYALSVMVFNCFF